MILTGLTRFRELGLLILRIGIGAAFMMHGYPKLMGGPDVWKQLGSVMPIPPAVAWGFVAAMIEFGGGVLLILGMLFRPACILLLLQMLAALFLVHFKNGDPFQGGLHHYSEALEMGIIFLAMLFIGPGKFSVDRK